MADDKEPRAAKPESLEAKFKLLALLPYDERVRRKHSLVFGFILDWYHSKYGDALASVRHVVVTIKDRDPAGKGLSVPHVHGALSDLVSWGYLHQDKGIGRRASRYVPNWGLLNSSVTPVGNTSSVTPGANTDVTSVGNARNVSVHKAGNKDPSTRTRSQDRGTGIDGQDCAAPSAPLSAGLMAADAGTAQDGFEELWRAYGYKRKKKEARAAYAKLDPDADLHATMVEAARAWRESWAAQKKPDAPRFHLHKWLEREEYECEPPTAYKSKERKDSGADIGVAKADNDDLPAPKWSGDISAMVPPGRRAVRITDAKHNEDGGNHEVTLVLEIDCGTVDMSGIEHRFFVQHQDENLQRKGNKHLEGACNAAGITDIENVEEFKGKELVADMGTDGSIRYVPFWELEDAA